MSSHRRFLWATGIVLTGLCLVSPVKLFAQEEATEETGTSNWREEFKADLEQLKQQRAEMKSNAEASRQEEKVLIDQMQEAIKNGDYETAKSLRQELRATHRENVEGMKSDRQQFKENRQELRSDVKNARENGQMPPRERQPRLYHYPDQGSEGQVREGERPLPPRFRDRPEGMRDRREDFRDRREDLRDKREDYFDRREDRHDRREDIRDRREDRWDAAHNYPPGSPEWRRDKAEDVRDRREDVRDHREDRFDRREDIRDKREDRHDRKEDIRDRRNDPEKENNGVRDHGKGVGRGKGQGGENRSPGQQPGPRGGRGR